MIRFTDIELGEMLDDTMLDQEVWVNRRMTLQQRLMFTTNVYTKTKLENEIIECTRMIDALNSEIVALVQEHQKRGYDV